MGNIMTLKYLVRPLDEKNVCDSIYETWSLIEALKKVEEQYKKNETKCIIVSCPEDFKKEHKSLVNIEELKK